MAEINESTSSTGKLLEVKNNQATKLSVDGSGNITMASGARVKDSSGVSRVVPNPTAKTIVDGSATALFTVPIAQGASVGGTIAFHVFASDGTDHQAMSGVANYASVNKAGTLTNAITNLTTTDAKAVSTGTITLAWTMAEDTADVVTIKLQPTGSLTETTYNVTYTVFPAKGEVTIV